MALALSSAAYANPEGGVVKGGAASIHGQGTKLDVHQHSERVVIDWRRFDIEVNEHTQFHQPHKGAVALNRVNSSDPSRIMGKLTANGNVILVNPNGVVFGKDSKVDVNGLIATTADINNQDFMAGKLAFTKPGNPNAAVINEGSITAKEAGLVALVAPNVVNNGVITARLGRAELASGDSFTADLYGDGLYELKVSDKVTSQLVANTGSITTEGGTIAITAAAGRQIVNSLVTIEGELKAPSIASKNGKIIIAAEGSNAVAGNKTADKGKKQGNSHVVIANAVLNASGRKAGERGGEIKVTGDQIALLDGTLIDASGHSGKSNTTQGKKLSDARKGAAGGDIQIGGDYLGLGDTPTAKNLYVSAGALVLNDALHEGDAGRTIFWSDDTTQFYGNVYARALGGLPIDPLTWSATPMAATSPRRRNTGDGGFVETSGKRHLDAGGYVNLTASNGNRGTYFLDPTNITIYGNFDPTDVSGLQLWLDGSDQSTLFSDTAGTAAIADGEAVARWNDKSNNGRYASQSNAGLRPQWSSNAQNGLGSLFFDGNKLLATNDFSFSQPNSQFATFAASSVASGNNYIYDGTIQNSNVLQIYGKLGIYNGSASGLWGGSGGYSISTSSNYLTSALVNGASSSLFLNGGNQLTGNPGAGSPGGLTIGNYAGGGYGFNGYIREYIGYDSVLTGDKRNLIEQYQSAKWGIGLTPPGTGVDEVTRATASDGYSSFTTRYLEHLSQTADVSLQATNNITLDLQGDTLNFATAGRSLTLTAGNQITTASAGTITTNGGAINLNATNGIAFSHAIGLNSNGGNITFNNAVTSSAAQDWNAGTGNISLNSTYAGSSHDLTLSAAQIDINSTLNVGTNSLTLKPATAKAIRVGGSSDNADDATYLDISAAEMARIQAGTLSIGDAALASATTIAGNIDLTGATGAAGTYHLALNTAGTFDSSGYTINLGRDALSFDGSNDYVVSSNNVGISGDTAFTLAGWYSFSDVKTLYGVMGFGNTGVAGATAGFWYGLNSNNEVSAQFAGARAAYVNSPISQNSWHHVAIVKTPGVINSTTTIYVDGVNLGTLHASSSSSAPALTDSPLYMGQWANYSSDRFVGLMDDIRVYNTALDATAVSALYNGGAGAAFNTEAGLRAGYQFSEGTGTTAADASGVSGNATLTNGPSWVRAQNLTVNASGAVTMGAAYGDGADISITGSAVTLAGKVAAMGDGTLNIASTNDITINSGASANASGSGNSLVLRSSAGNFVNNADASALSAANGRWIVYSQNAADNTVGGLTAAQTIYGETYGSLAPAAITTPTYNATQNTFVYNDAPGTLTFTANSLSKTYGSANPTLTYSFSCSTGCTEADAVTGAPTLSTAAVLMSSVADGPYDITIGTGTLALTGGFSTYTINFVNGALTILQKALSITGLAGVDKTYDRSVAATLSGTAALDGVESGDTVTLGGAASASFANWNAGTNKAITVSGYSLGGADAGNYSLTQPTGLTASILQKAITLTGLSAANKIYDATTTATLTGTGSLSGIETGDTVSYNAGSATFADKNVGTGKTVTASGFSLAGADASNYTLTQPGSWLADITAKAITLTGLSAANKTYDATTTATLTGTGSLLGIETGDTVSYNAGSATFADKNVGTGKTVTATGFSLTGADAGNYSLTQPASFTASIDKAALSVALVDAAPTRQVGASNPSFSLAYNGFFASENESELTTLASATTTADASSAVGIYDITITAGTATNYSFNVTNPAGTLTITPLPAPPAPSPVVPPEIETPAIEVPTVLTPIRPDSNAQPRPIPETINPNTIIIPASVERVSQNPLVGMNSSPNIIATDHGSITETTPLANADNTNNASNVNESDENSTSSQSDFQTEKPHEDETNTTNAPSILKGLVEFHPSLVRLLRFTNNTL